MSQVAFLNNGVIPPPGPILTLTGDLGGPVPPTAGNINIITDVAINNGGATFYILGTPGSSTLTIENTDLTHNIFFGTNSGNNSYTGSQNTGIGASTLHALTSGSSNVAVGYLSLTALNSGSDNIGIGLSAGSGITTGTHNVAVGTDALEVMTTGTENTAIGDGALALLSTSYSYNTGIGSGALADVLTGQANTALGINAGTNYTTNESSNLVLGNTGVVGDNNTIRIGQQGSGLGQQNKAFIAGTYGVTPSGTLQAVTINSSGQLGSESFPSSGIQTIDGDTGSITGSTVTIFANNSALNCGSTVSFTNSGTTSTLNVSNGGNTFIGLGAGNNSLSGSNCTGLGYGAMNALTSGNSNAAFGFQALGALTSGYGNAAFGNSAGIGCQTSIQSTFIGYASGLNITGGIDNTLIGRNTGQNYNSTESYNIIMGAGIPGIIGESNVIRIGNNNSSGIQITGANNSFLHNYGTNNTFVGSSAGNFTLSGSTNTGVGTSALASLTTGINNIGIGNSSNGATNGQYNIAIGPSALAAIGGGIDNVAVGDAAGLNFNGAQGNTVVGHAACESTTGNYNSVLGHEAMVNGGGSQNVVIGAASGVSYTGSESSNILINSSGVASESYVLRIGKATGTADQNLNAAYICGIQGITVTGTAVLVSSSDQLGTTVSSQRYKENIEELLSSKVLDLKPKSFNYTVGEDRSRQTGLIAEEVHEVMPELVVLDKQGLPQTVKYQDLPVLLLLEIQKLRKELNELKGRL